MNDRLMIAAMAAQADLSRSDAKDRLFASIAADAFRMADALLAAAGEQSARGDSDFYKSMVRYREEAMAQIARAEAAEAKVAELEAKLAAVARLAQDSAEAAGEMVGSKPTANDRAVERILDAVDHARAVGLLISPEFLEDIIREEAAHD